MARAGATVGGLEGDWLHGGRTGGRLAALWRARAEVESRCRDGDGSTLDELELVDGRTEESGVDGVCAGAGMFPACGGWISVLQRPSAKN